MPTRRLLLCLWGKMIFQQLLKTLEDRGLQPTNALGEQFDPNFHEAVRMNSDSDGELVVTSELLRVLI